MTDNRQCHESLVVLCGLPGVGKTQFVEKLDCPQDLHPATIYHICYDDFIPNNLSFDETHGSASGTVGALQVNGLTWKQLRGNLLQCVEKLVAKNCLASNLCTSDVQATDSKSTIARDFDQRLGERVKRKGHPDQVGPCDAELEGFTFYVIDDNMFYRSMRYEYYQMARKYNLGFCEIHVHCPFNVAKERNQHRQEPISDDTLVAMDTKLEVPDAAKYPWETKNITISTVEEADQDTMEGVWNLIRMAVSDPVPPLEEENTAEKEASMKAIAASVIYQADQILRKCVAESMKQAKAAPGLPKKTLKELGGKVSMLKNQILEDIRNHKVQLDFREGLCQEQLNVSAAGDSGDWLSDLTLQVTCLFQERYKHLCEGLH